MAEERFVLSVALDGVIADFYAGLRPLAAEWLGVSEASLRTDVSRDLREWNLAGQGDRAQAYENFIRYAICRRDLFSEVPPMTDAPATLRRLAALDAVRVQILVDRPRADAFGRDVLAQTVQWLERHAVPYWDVCVTENRVTVNADMYVEESPDNVLLLRAAERYVVVFTNSTNRHLKAQHVRSWARLEKMVHKKLRLWTGHVARGPGVRQAAAREPSNSSTQRDSSA
jgi:hypothetical protein